ncbi:MAG: hypothetical protein P4M08_13685 [Oligoflexia bacterium]|nr:hypothetical protein [Oligoflexia bacterium]
MSNISSTDGGYQYYQRKVNDLEDEMRAENKRARERLNEQSESQAAGYRRGLNEQERKSNEAANEIRQNFSDETRRERENARTEVEREKARTYDRFGKAAAEVAEAQKNSDQAMHDLQQNYEHRLEKQKFEPRKDDSGRKAAAAIAAERSSRENETRELRSDIKDLLAAEKTYQKEKGQATQDVRRETEADSRAKQTLLQTSYEDQLAKLKRDNESDNRLNRDHERQALHDKDVETANVIRQSNNTLHSADELSRENFNRLIAQQKQLSDETNKNHEQQIERMAKNSNEEMQKSLDSQANAYRQRMADQETRNSAQTDRLQNQIKMQTTSTDGSQVSPAYADALRKNLTTEYEKRHQANIDRMQSKHDETLESYNRKLAEIQYEKEKRITDLHTQHELENQQERTSFMDHVNNLEQDRELTQRRAAADSNRQATTMTKDHAHALEKQRQDYDQLFSDTRADAQRRISEVTQKAEFDSKMAQRGFAQRENELIRDHQKQMAEQKTAYDDQINEMKAQFGTATRDIERRNKQNMEDQARGYEQRIQQLEFQSKERERMISENYQDQIEKMKRSDALLRQKKS